MCLQSPILLTPIPQGADVLHADNRGRSALCVLTAYMEQLFAHENDTDCSAVEEVVGDAVSYDYIPPGFSHPDLCKCPECAGTPKVSYQHYDQAFQQHKLRHNAGVRQIYDCLLAEGAAIDGLTNPHVMLYLASVRSVYDFPFRPTTGMFPGGSMRVDLREP